MYGADIRFIQLYFLWVEVIGTTLDIEWIVYLTFDKSQHLNKKKKSKKSKNVNNKNSVEYKTIDD